MDDATNLKDGRKGVPSPSHARAAVPSRRGQPIQPMIVPMHDLYQPGIYRYWLDDDRNYIGQARVLGKRIGQHIATLSCSDTRANQVRFEVLHTCTVCELSYWEVYYCLLYRPALNVGDLSVAAAIEVQRDFPELANVSYLNISGLITESQKAGMSSSRRNAKKTKSQIASGSGAKAIQKAIEILIGASNGK